MASTLEEKINMFYSKHAPKMLQNDGLTGILAWTHNHGEVALNERLMAKYRCDLTDVSYGTLDQHWQQIRESLIEFYGKWDPFKDASEVDAVFNWTKKHGLYLLNERLNTKYKDFLAETVPNPETSANSAAKQVAKIAIGEDNTTTKGRTNSSSSTKSAPKLPDRKNSGKNTPKASDKKTVSDDQDKNIVETTTTPAAAPPAAAASPAATTSPNHASAAAKPISTKVVMDTITVEDPKEVAKETENKEVLEKLIEFFAKHDTEKSHKDIEFLAGFATRHGFETVNHQLKLNFGVGLEDVGYVHKSVLEIPQLSQAVKPTKLKPTQPQPAPSVPAMQAAAASSQGANNRQQQAKSISPDEELELRRNEISAKLKDFYKKNDPSRLLPENVASFNKVVDYGVEKGLIRLNGALREKFKEDLDDMAKLVLRKSMAPYFKKSVAANVDLQNKLAEEAVSFAIQNGKEALDEKLKQEYGVDTTGKLGEV